ncbi:MAG: GPW/gp25 family protein [Synergistaceae bacterium]|nr:GPW/gp25 family protein [Synergistaceae bacterium]
MQEIDLILDKPQEINFAPVNELQEILQNVRTILTTYKFSVPLDREFGISATFLDEAQPRAIALLSSEIAEAINLYEPRAKLREINFNGDSDGRFYPVIRVRLNLNE